MQNDTNKNSGTTAFYKDAVIKGNHSIGIGQSTLSNGTSPFDDRLKHLSFKCNHNLNTNKTMENKKYIAPFDIGRIGKGEILTKHDFYNIYQSPKNDSIHAEIVEAFFKEYIEPKKLITMDDIIVGKTVLVHNPTSTQFLVIGKDNTSCIVGMSWHHIDFINENFTIKQI